MCGKRLAFLYTSPYPAGMRRWANVGLLLGQRRRQWANNKPTLAQHLMFAGYEHVEYNVADGGPTLFHNWAMYRLMRVVASRGIKSHLYGSQSKHWTINQFCFNVEPASNKIARH